MTEIFGQLLDQRLVLNTPLTGLTNETEVKDVLISVGGKLLVIFYDNREADYFVAERITVVWRRVGVVSKSFHQ